jgi:nicotinamide-nucleotide amidase
MNDQPLIEPDLTLATQSVLQLEAQLVTLAEQIGLAAVTRELMICTAESCTGGAIARALTEISGSSAWFDSGYVTYSNEAKQRMLGVAAASLDEHGAVSEPVARAMAQGAVVGGPGRVSIAVTGVAGPGGGSAEKPVGTVWFGWAGSAQSPDSGPFVASQRIRFDGDRHAVRLQTAIHGLRQLKTFWL